MDKIWAPWRSKYIYLRKKQACIFCGNKDPKNKPGKKYILERGRFSFSMLNIYPYNNGHVMVAPYRHVGSLEDLKADELTGLFEMVARTKKNIDRSFKPDGYNIGLNLGKVAGAGFTGHVHVHVVPRWTGDTNFMPIIGNTKVVAESLETVYNLLKK